MDHFVGEDRTEPTLGYVHHHEERVAARVEVAADPLREERDRKRGQIDRFRQESEH
jgi:hypothetical protein